jgi:ferredoxin/flavodoxin
MMLSMNAPIFFFSGTGNTAWCAERLGEHLRRRGVTTPVSSIETIDREVLLADLDRADIVGLGWPVYGSDLPEPMKRFLDLLPDGRGRRVFAFCTQLFFSGNGARVYERELRERNWTIGWSAHFRMPNNICVTAFRIPFSSDPSDHLTRLERTEKKIDRFAGAIACDNRFTQGKGFLPAVLGLMQRAPYRKWFPSLRDDIGIDHELCTRCGRCVAICPVKNLTLENGRIESHGRCVLCVRCYNFCPVQAVCYRGKAHIAKRGVPYRGPVAGFRPEKLVGSL